MKPAIALMVCLCLVSCKHPATVTCIPGGVHLSEGHISFNEIERQRKKLGCEDKLIEGSGPETYVE